MINAQKNFVYSGKTYFVGDEVPANVATAVDPSCTEKPKAKKITLTTNILEGE
jgi:hypothetical protein|tara:strand:+ start:362 stop:520 length:159 start_codon:yes stop_codon:yes gene_type:complete